MVVTDQDLRSRKIYFASFSSIPLLTAGEEIDLAKAVAAEPSSYLEHGAAELLVTATTLPIIELYFQQLAEESPVVQDFHNAYNRSAQTHEKVAWLQDYFAREREDKSSLSLDLRHGIEVVLGKADIQQRHKDNSVVTMGPFNDVQNDSKNPNYQRRDRAAVKTLAKILEKGYNLQEALKEKQAFIRKERLQSNGQFDLQRVLREYQQVAPALDRASTELVKAYTQLVHSTQKAQDEFITRNLRMVSSKAKFIKSHNLDYLDFVQEGTIGLTRAVEKFDYRRGFKFSTYAHRWILQAMNSAKTESSTIRIPAYQREKFNRMKKSINEIEAVNGREFNYASREDMRYLAEGMCEDIKDVRELVLSYQKTLCLSLDHPTGKEEDSLFGDHIAHATAEKQVTQKLLDQELQEKVNSVIDSLEDPRHKKILRLRYGIGYEEPLTLDQISKIPEINLSRQRVQQIEQQALRKLRHPRRIETLEDFRSNK